MREKMTEIMGLSQALGNTGVCTFMYLPKTKTITIPEKARKIYQCSEIYTNMPYSFASDFVYKDDQPGFNDMYFKIDAGVQTAAFIFRNHEQTARCHVTLTTVTTDEAGQPEEVLGIIENESTEMLRTRELNKLVEALSDDCFAVLSVELPDGAVKLMRVRDGSASLLVKFFEEEHHYQQYLDYCAVNLILPDQRAGFLAQFEGCGVRSALCRSKAVTIRYKRVNEGKQNHLEAKFVDISEQRDGSRAVLAYRYIDEQVKKEEAYRQELQKAAEEAKSANLAKTDFLSRMSHDMRTPLNGIIGSTYLALEQANPPATREYLHNIDVSSKFLLGLINDVLEMTRIENGKVELHPEPIFTKNLKTTVDAMLIPLCAEKGQRLLAEVDLPTDYLPLLDRMYCSRIFFNILNNAAKYTPEGGTIGYKVQGTLLPGNQQMALRVEVADSGIGMSEEFQKVMFDSFTQERHEDSPCKQGTGLGLAIVKKLMDIMHGTIKVQSRLGEGTTFILEVVTACVPSAKGPDRARAGASRNRTDQAFAGKRILLCEDHPLNRQIAKKLLTEKGLLVDTAEDGQIGLQKYKLSPTGYYDVILMDIRMPVMDGHAAAKAIRALPRPDAGKVPIIALSANAFTEDIQKSKAAGMTDHVSKPVDPQTLYATLAKYVLS